MDDEIDLRPFAQALRRHWRLIVALTVLAAAASALLSLVLPNQFEATTIVSVVQPNAPPVDTLSPAASLARAHLELARSGDLLAEVYAQSASDLPPQINSPAALASLLTAEAAGDPKLLRLKVRDTDARRAAALADTWARVLVARADRLFPQYQANLTLAQGQLDAATIQLKQASAALSEFQASSRVGVLTAQRDSQQASLTSALDREHQLELLAKDAGGLAALLKALPPGDPARLAEDAALLALTLRLYGPAAGSSPASTPIPEIGAGRFLAGPTVADQSAYALKLVDTIAAQLVDIAGQAAELEAKISAAEGQLAEAAARQAELTQARDLAQGQYVLTAGQVEAAELLVQQSASSIMIVSQARAAVAPIGPNRSLNTLIGGALGLALGVLFAALSLATLNKGEMRAQSMA